MVATTPSLLLVFLQSVCVATAWNLEILPKPRSWILDSDGGSFNLSAPFIIAVDTAFANSTTSSSLSLIPPTLFEFASTFASDLGLSPSPAVSLASSPPTHGLWLTIANDSNTTLSAVTLANGSPSLESYAIHISSELLTITGASALASFWATRTILQAAELNGGLIPTGTIVDGPEYGIRGHMLDVGRHWYSAEYLTELCAFLSYFKMNEFHVHLSDQVSPSNIALWQDYYARFRLFSTNPDFRGLALQNESYDFTTYQHFQKDCAARGVTIISEIEAPGHALPVTQWRQKVFNQSIYRTDDPTLLNLTIPASTQIMKDIWSEFLPWMQATEVSIGADEYPSDLADDYITFVNGLDMHIRNASGKAIRAWGTNEPSMTMNISHDVTIQHWALFDDDPVQVVDDGYQIINSQDWVFYEVVKFSTSYPQAANLSRFFDFGDPPAGLVWNASLFNWTDIPHNPSPSNPLLRGAIAPVWNDNGPAASTDLEEFDEAWNLIAVSASLSWGSNGLDQSSYVASASTLAAAAPAQNLARRVPSVGPAVLQYDFATTGLHDNSGNGYDATVNGSGSNLGSSGIILREGNSLQTPLGSKGLPHVYSLDLSLSHDAELVLRGPDTTLTLQNDAPPMIHASNGFAYPLRDLVTNQSLPVSFSSRTNITFRTTLEKGTEAWQDDQKIGNFNTPLSHFLNETFYAWVQMAFVAPAHELNVAKGTATITAWSLSDE